MDSRSSAAISTTYSRPLRVMWTRSCVRSTSSAISDSLTLTSDSGSVLIDQDYSLKCWKTSGMHPRQVVHLILAIRGAGVGALRPLVLAGGMLRGSVVVPPE